MQLLLIIMLVEMLMEHISLNSKEPKRALEESMPQKKKKPEALSSWTDAVHLGR